MKIKIKSHTDTHNPHKNSSRDTTADSSKHPIRSQLHTTQSAPDFNQHIYPLLAATTPLNTTASTDQTKTTTKKEPTSNTTSRQPLADARGQRHTTPSIQYEQFNYRFKRMEQIK